MPYQGSCNTPNFADTWRSAHCRVSLSNMRMALPNGAPFASLSFSTPSTGIAPAAPPDFPRDVAEAVWKQCVLAMRYRGASRR